MVSCLINCTILPSYLIGWKMLVWIYEGNHVVGAKWSWVEIDLAVWKGIWASQSQMGSLRKFSVWLHLGVLRFTLANLFTISRHLLLYFMLIFNHKRCLSLKERVPVQSISKIVWQPTSFYAMLRYVMQYSKLNHISNASSFIQRQRYFFSSASHHISKARWGLAIPAQ